MPLKCRRQRCASLRVPTLLHPQAAAAPRLASYAPYVLHVYILHMPLSAAPRGAHLYTRPRSYALRRPRRRASRPPHSTYSTCTNCTCPERRPRRPRLARAVRSSAMRAPHQHAYVCLTMCEHPRRASVRQLSRVPPSRPLPAWPVRLSALARCTRYKCHTRAVAIGSMVDHCLSCTGTWTPLAKGP